MGSFHSGNNTIQLGFRPDSINVSFLYSTLWGKVAQWMLLSEHLRPLVLLLQHVTDNAVAAVSTIALAAFLMMFQILYLLFSALMYFSVPMQARSDVSILPDGGSHHAQPMDTRPANS